MCFVDQARVPTVARRTRNAALRRAMLANRIAQNRIAGNRRGRCALRETAPERLARGDIHRDFKAETHIRVARGGPLHSRPPFAMKSAVKTAVPSQRAPWCATPVASAHVAVATVVPAASETGKKTAKINSIQLTRLTVAKPQRNRSQMVTRADCPLWTHFSFDARDATGYSGRRMQARASVRATRARRRRIKQKRACQTG
jgi:hypothetical protein